MEKSLKIIEDRIKELLNEEDLRGVKDILNSLNHFDIAEIFNELNEFNLTVSFNLLSKDVAAKVFAEMNIEQQKLLIDGFSNLELE